MRPVASRRVAATVDSHWLVTHPLASVEHMFAFQSSPADRRPPVPDGLRSRIAPVLMASERVLPVSTDLADLLPGGSLRRGTTTMVSGAPGSGAISLGVSLLAEASSSGHWCAAVGIADPGVIAMAEMGLDLRRAVFVPRPRAGWAEVAAEMLDGMELVVLRPPARVPYGAARVLAGRARERRSALVVVVDDPRRWPLPAEVTLEVGASSWQGIGMGDGRLSARRCEVSVHGRHGKVRERTVPIWLPSPAGTVRVAAGT